MQIQTEQPKNGADEHILVCLSSSPSNARIIHTAAKMAKVLHAKFTAIYVQTDSVESEKNRLRLEQNIQLAQGLGAEIISYGIRRRADNKHCNYDFNYRGRHWLFDLG